MTTSLMERVLIEQQFTVECGVLSPEQTKAVAELGQQAVESARTQLSESKLSGLEVIFAAEKLFGCSKAGFTSEQGFERLTLHNFTPLEDISSIPPNSPCGLLVAAAETAGHDLTTMLDERGRRITMLGFAHYKPGVGLPAGPAIYLPKYWRALLYGFPINRGHRDTLARDNFVDSEQVSGAPSRWEIRTTSRQVSVFEQRTGDRVRMRAKVRKGTRGNPWHHVQNTAEGARGALITVVGRPK